MFELVEIQEDHVRLTHYPILNEPETVHVALGDLKKWRVSKQAMPKCCPAELAQACLPQGHAGLLEESARLVVAKALHDAAVHHAVTADQVVFAQPMALLAKKQLPKQSLKLVPLGSVAKAKEEAKLAVEHGGIRWSISMPKQNSTFSEEGSHPLIPFFWAKPCQDEEDANLRWGHASVGGVKIPILTNYKAIKMGEVLQYQKEAIAAQPSPSKKARKSN